MSMLSNLLKDGPNSTSFQKHEETLFLISEVSEIVSLEPKTIRYYEKAGLLTPRRLGQLRVFSQTDLEILALVKLLRQYEMPISDVRKALYLHMHHCEENDAKLKQMLERKIEMLSQKHKEIAQQIETLGGIEPLQDKKFAA